MGGGGTEGEERRGGGGGMVIKLKMRMQCFILIYLFFVLPALDTVTASTPPPSSICLPEVS